MIIFEDIFVQPIHQARKFSVLLSLIIIATSTHACMPVCYR